MNEVPPIGTRVQRNRPYREEGRALSGTVVRVFHEHDANLGHPSPTPTHAVVDWDDGRTGKVHPSALDEIVLPRPPRFASIEEADAWLEANVEPPCLHRNVMTVFQSTTGVCEDCRATVAIDPKQYRLYG